MEITLGVCKSCNSTQIMRDIALISRKIYTAGKNFTRPPVVTVATNLNSGFDLSKGVKIYFDLHLNLTKYLFWLPKGVNFTLPSLPVPNWPLVPQMPLDRATRPTRSKLAFALRNKWHPYISFFFMFDIVTLDSEWFFFTE